MAPRGRTRTAWATDFVTLAPGRGSCTLNSTRSPGDTKSDSCCLSGSSRHLSASLWCKAGQEAFSDRVLCQARPDQGRHASHVPCPVRQGHLAGVEEQLAGSIHTAERHKGAETRQQSVTCAVYWGHSPTACPACVLWGDTHSMKPYACIDLPTMPRSRPPPAARSGACLNISLRVACSSRSPTVTGLYMQHTSRMGGSPVVASASGGRGRHVTWTTDAASPSALCLPAPPPRRHAPCILGATAASRGRGAQRSTKTGAPPADHALPPPGGNTPCAALRAGTAAGNPETAVVHKRRARVGCLCRVTVRADPPASAAVPDGIFCA